MNMQGVYERIVKRESDNDVVVMVTPLAMVSVVSVIIVIGRHLRHLRFKLLVLDKLKALMIKYYEFPVSSRAKPAVRK